MSFGSEELLLTRAKGGGLGRSLIPYATLVELPLTDTQSVSRHPNLMKLVTADYSA